MRRALSYLSFAAVSAIVAPFVAGRPDTVWVYHGPFTTGLSSLFFKFAYRSRLVFTCADLWPESFKASGVVKSRLVMRIAGAYNRALHRAADLIVCSSRGTRRHFEEAGIASERLTVIPVWIGGIGKLASKTSAPSRESVNIVYAGNLGPAQKLDTLIRAAAEMRKETSPVRFEIFGSGASEKELRTLAVQLGATNVEFRGRVPVEEAFMASSRALAQIICLQPSPLFARTIPSKVFSAFAAGSPILYGLQGDAEALVAGSRGGISFDASDPLTLIGAIKHLLALSTGERDAMRARLRQYFADNFDPTDLLTQYVAILQSPSAPPTAEPVKIELTA